MTDINDWPSHPDADPDCECCLGDGLQADGETPCPCIDARKANIAALTIPPAPQPEGEPVTLTYTNWRGETAQRTITPKRIWWGATDWHPEPQWLLTAFDAEKQADRDFAIKDFGAATPPAAQVTVADAIAALKAMPTRTEALGGQDFKYIQLGEALDTLRALAGDGRRRQMKALIVGGPNRGQVVDMSNVVHTDSRYFGCKFGDKEFHFIVGADVPNPYEYVMRELCRAYEFVMKGETRRQHVGENGKL